MLQQLLFVSAKKFMSRTFLNVHLVTVNLKKVQNHKKISTVFRYENSENFSQIFLEDL
jgi:hypothetical protein